jgi:isopentenyl phosphate kinase
MFIIKLGGSVITDKSKKSYFKKEIMDKLSKKIKRANRKCIIIHGAGSFGHILAKKYNLNHGFKDNTQLIGFSETMHMVQVLNTHVLKSLNQNGIQAISIIPHNIIELNNHKMHKINYKIFSDYIKNNFTPVTFGDVVLDKKLGFSICSGDLLTFELARYFKPKKVIFVIDEDGIYTSNPKINKKAELLKQVNRIEIKKLSTDLNNHADVTKGMGGKIYIIDKIAKLGIDTILLNGNKPERLYNTLVNDKIIGTIVRGERSESNRK